MARAFPFVRARTSGVAGVSKPLRHRLSVASRVLAGFGGGYGLVSLLIAVLALVIPGEKASVVLWVTMASYLVYAAIVMAVFHMRSATRAWLWLLACAAPLALALCLLSA